MSAKLVHPWVQTLSSGIYLLSLPGSSTDHEILTLCDAIRAWLPRVDDYYGLIVDGRGLMKSNIEQRKKIVNTAAQLREYSNRWCAGKADVADAGVARGMLTSFRVLRKPRYPYKMFANLADAREWTQTQLNAFRACRGKCRGEPAYFSDVSLPSMLRPSMQPRVSLTP